MDLILQEDVLAFRASKLNKELSSLSILVNVVAAMSCEALRADVTAFHYDNDCVSKEVFGVAHDMNIFLNGSKLVGNVEIKAVSMVPEVHACLKMQATLLQSTNIEALRTPLLALASVLFDLGNHSLMRAKGNSEYLVRINDTLSKFAADSFSKECPCGDRLREAYSKLHLELAFELREESYGMLINEVNVFLAIVWEIVAWEAITAYVSIKDKHSTQNGQKSRNIATEVNGGGAVAKGEEREVGKKVLGKGTNDIVIFIKEILVPFSSNKEDNEDRLVPFSSNKEDNEDRLVPFSSNKEDYLPLLQDMLSFFNPKDPRLVGLLIKVKEILLCKEKRRLPKIPKGTRDFANEQTSIRDKAFSIIKEVFERHGATKLDTPVFELRETLMEKYGEDSKLVYDLADQGGELCSLRYDLTVPFARYVAMNRLTSFRRYQIDKVFRRDNPAKGRFREFYQCDFDIAGQNGKMGSDFEVVYILTELLDELNIGEYEIKLNHRNLLDAMLKICGVHPDKFRTICSSIDKLDKQPFELIKREMVEEKGLSVEIADKIGGFVQERGPPLELLYKLKQAGGKFMENKLSIDALNDLEILFKALDKSRHIERVVFDLSLARGLDYYTGIIFEAVFKGGVQVGSIGAGGRYDDLIKTFGKKEVPAVGLSLGIERVFTIMEQLYKDQNQSIRATKTEVLVSILGDDPTLSADLMSELWKANIKTVYLLSKKMMKHIEFAQESRIPWMIIVGENEISKGVVKLKDFEANREEIIPRNAIVEELQKRLNA